MQNGLVPLCYLSPYKDDGLFIRARIYNVADTLLATKDLTHVEDGRYSDATYFMPAEPSLKVRYDVFTEASYVSKSFNEGSKDERFDLIKTDDALVRNDTLYGVFDTTTPVLTGTLKLAGQLSGVLTQDSGGFTGVLEDNLAIVAKFDTLDSIIGIVKCKG